MEKIPCLVFPNIAYLLILLKICLAMTAAHKHNNITTDQDALLGFKDHITSAAHQILSRNWSVSASVCDWIGVTCGSRHHRVTALNISYMGLSGTIPPQLGNLSFLASLDIASNNFYGELPSELSHLRRLKVLDLENNSLSGEIPSWIGSLHEVQFLIMGNNSFTGSIPNSIYNLSKLEDLRLTNNYLQGGIPQGIGSTLPNLKKLVIENNQISGPIPHDLFNISSLEVIALRSNSLFGTLPMSMCNRLKKLRWLNLGDNKLNGEIPSGLSLCSGLQILSLSINEFGGFIPRENGNLMLLERLYLGSNNLKGKGSFGSVYRATMRGGRIFAVKVFNADIQAAFKSFERECEVLRNLRHRNITKVISNCSNPEFKALILEFMPNGSLDKWLYSHNHCLDIMQRLNIMIDVACALEYLHSGYVIPVVHCDLKPSNILLDQDMVAHVSDFVISKVLSKDDSITYTKTIATFGYVAPEYGLEGLVSPKCDVYGYGIILMEVFTRTKPSDEMFGGDLNFRSLVSDSVPNALAEIIDVNLLSTEEVHFNRKMSCLNLIMEVALNCTKESPRERSNIKNVLATLGKIKLQLASVADPRDRFLR